MHSAVMSQNFQPGFARISCTKTRFFGQFLDNFFINFLTIFLMIYVLEFLKKKLLENLLDAIDLNISETLDTSHIYFISESFRIKVASILIPHSPRYFFYVFEVFLLYSVTEKSTILSTLSMELWVSTSFFFFHWPWDSITFSIGNDYCEDGLAWHSQSYKYQAL